MGIFDEVNKALKSRDQKGTQSGGQKGANPWPDADDKLEEWIGIVPPGTMPGKKPPYVQKPKESSDDLIINIELIEKPEDLYSPSNFKSSVDYATAIHKYNLRISTGYYAGFKFSLTMNNIVHRRVIFEPIKDRNQALQSSNFLLAVAKAVESILQSK